MSSLLKSDEEIQSSIEDMVTDWYIPEDDLTDGFAYPGPIDFVDSEPMLEMADQILEECKKQVDKKSTLEFSMEVSGRRFRGHKIESITGNYYSVRRLPSVIPGLKELGLPKGIVKILENEKLQYGGIIIISGETGQGKSTTTGATIKNRLDTFSSFCLTIEDPVELPLHGKHGKGRCIQTEIDSGRFAEALKGAVRSYPAKGNCILYLGEARDAETAYEALVAASNGHLVFTTVHAYDVASTINRFISMAQSHKNANEELVRGLFAAAFRLILNQKLIKKKMSNEDKLEIEMLFNKNGKGAISQAIKNGKIGELSTEIEKQNRQVQMNQINELLKGWI